MNSLERTVLAREGQDTSNDISLTALRSVEGRGADGALLDERGWHGSGQGGEGEDEVLHFGWWLVWGLR